MSPPSPRRKPWRHRLRRGAILCGILLLVAFVLDRDGSIARGFEGVRLTPTSYILNRRGEIVHKILGEPDFDKLHAVLDKLLAEPA